jgi:hypothetical protein
LRLSTHRRSGEGVLLARYPIQSTRRQGRDALYFIVAGLAFLYEGVARNITQYAPKGLLLFD